MVNLWIEWQRLIRAGTMMSETLTASQEVVAHRSRTIENAVSDPMQADYSELGRMVSEKASAFGAAAMSLSRDWLAMQRDMTAQMNDVTSMMMGRLPGPAKAQAMFARSQRIGSSAVSSSVRAMQPIHRTAIANQRRLERKG